jgi:4-amino-4-deoxy-L-arabinose transferase-like glycosyltransferase
MSRESSFADPNTASPGRVFLWIFGLFFTVRVAFALAFPLEPTSDAAFYFRVAEDLASGRGYTDQGYPSAFAPVGFPLLLAVFFKFFGVSLWTAYVMNLFAAIAIFWCMIGIGRRLQIPDTAIQVGVLIYALYPNAIAYQTHILSELTFTAFLMAGIWAILGRPTFRNWLLAGVLFGVAGLIRSTAFPFIFGALLALWMTRKTWGLKQFLAVLVTVYAVVALVQLPWVLRNHHIFGEWIISSTHGGVVLYDGNNDFAQGEPTGILTEPKFKPILEALPVPLSKRHENPVGFNRSVSALAHQWIGENTDRFLAMMPRKLLLLWMKDGEGAWAYELGYPARAKSVIWIARWTNQLIYGLIILLAFPAAIVGLRGLLRRQEREAQLCHLFLFAILTSMIAIVYFGFSRYHFPAMPTLCLAAGWSLLWLNALRLKRKNPDLAARHASLSVASDDSDKASIKA